MIKRFFMAAAVIAALFSVGAMTQTGAELNLVRTASAAAEQHFTGNWYDKEGHFVVSVQPGVINSCRIVHTYGVTEGNPGSGHFVILEAAGEHDLFGEWEGGYWQNNNYVEPHLTINHGEKLSRK